MSYLSLYNMAQDQHLRQRVSACAAQEGTPPRVAHDGYGLVQHYTHEQWTTDHILLIAASPGWGQAWDSALAANIDDPGTDPGVITDGMILSAVQALATTPAA